eukprot:gnl/TRDRNA2_/TRDRNA2_195528_c0_seq1.p1 gnl/TRDRNA2_/TRDRNA2_195528_c0~~gnl/TRDRNA2_/TRDRNA2_195528_c0_seq1.p1  ORF type:complete len:391 (-),score=49.08 gnl/TRDRNA2_/TRDRNA2_195528_c0_seq1:80-1147(-)
MAADGAGLQQERQIIETNDVQKVKHQDGTKSVNGFQVQGLLGSGSFAKVKLCEERSSCEKFAMKVFRKGRLRRQRDFIGGGEGGRMKIKTALDKVYGEVAMLKRISHPSCIRLYAIFDEDDKDGKLYLVLELAQGPTMEWDAEILRFYVPATKGVVPELTAKLYVHDVAYGLAYLHRASIAHRDIKPQNLLVDADGRAKIADFGVAIDMEEEGLIKGTEGTYYFYPPECCLTGYEGHDGRKADIWALGVSLFAFLYGCVPFFAPDLAALFETIARANFEVPDRPTFSMTCREALTRLLARSPSDRPFAWDLVEDPWCKGAAVPGPQGMPQSGLCAGAAYHSSEQPRITARNSAPL